MKLLQYQRYLLPRSTDPSHMRTPVYKYIQSIPSLYLDTPSTRDKRTTHSSSPNRASSYSSFSFLVQSVKCKRDQSADACRPQFSSFSFSSTLVSGCISGVDLFTSRLQHRCWQRRPLIFVQATASVLFFYCHRILIC